MNILMFCALLGLGALPEGEVVTLPIPNSNHVTIKLMFQTGSVDDPADKLGLTNLTARLMVGGGNKTLTKQQIDEMTYPMAVAFDVTVDKEVTTFTTRAHVDNLEKTYDIFRGLILEPRFDETDFQRILKDVRKDVAEDIPNNNDEVLSKRVLDTILFADHPYGPLVEGTVAGLDNITVADVKAHYKKYFTKKRLMIGLAGGYKDAFKTRVVKDMQSLPEGDRNFKKIPKPAMPNGVVTCIVEKKRAFGSAVFMGYPLDLDRSDNEFAALMVANSYLGEHRKSYGRLYTAMRSTRSLNYGDYSYIEWYPNGHATQLPLPGHPRSTNYFSMWIRPVQIAEQFKGVEGLEPPALGNGHHSIRQCFFELGKLIDNGMTAEDFERTRKFLMGYMKLYIQSPERRLGFLMDSRFYGRQDYISEMIALLDKLKLEDVNKAIKKYFQNENMAVAVITDDSEAAKLATSIRTNGSAPIVYKPVVRKGLSEDILNEDKQIDALKLNATKVEVVPLDSLFKK